MLAPRRKIPIRAFVLKPGLYQTTGTVTLGGAIESACGAKMRRKARPCDLTWRRRA